MAGYFGTKASVTQVDGYSRDEADAQFLTPTGDASGLTGLPAGYTDADVDTHLNTSTAAAGQILSYTGSDYDWITSAADIEGVTAGSGLTGGGTSGTVTISHQDTSSQGSVNNSGKTVIQDVTLDTYGHITGLTSTTIDTAPPSGIGGVGTYLLANHNQNVGTMTPGTTVAASTLRPTSCGSASNTGYTVSGTWRLMGHKSGSNTSWGGEYESSLWVRIS